MVEEGVTIVMWGRIRRGWVVRWQTLLKVSDDGGKVIMASLHGELKLSHLGSDHGFNT